MFRTFRVFSNWISSCRSFTLLSADGCLYSLFIPFLLSCISFKETGHRKVLTLPYSYNLQMFNNKMNEKKNSGVSEYEHPGYVIVVFWSFLWDDFIVLFDFCTVLKILICFSLIKRFPNDRKRYSSRLQVSASSGSYNSLLHKLWEL